MSGYDVCVIGSGAGGGPVAASMAEAGYRVVLLEKGPWYTNDQFLKDEVELCRRNRFMPAVADDPQVWEIDVGGGRTAVHRTDALRNGTLVGGANVLMSGFFLRLKPTDFRMLSTYGPVAGADVADWPISYDDLEPYYARVENEVGVSGLAVDMPAHLQDRRSSEDFPFLPTREHPFADHIDTVCTKSGLHPFPIPRAVLPEQRGERRGCAYSGYCAQYGCRTGAKGSSLQAWVPRALRTGRCDLRPRAAVTKLVTDSAGRLRAADYRDRHGRLQRVEATIFVVACQAIESARLLLNSRSARHPDGLGNRNGRVGRHLVASTFGGSFGEFRFRDDDRLRSKEPFLNRGLQDWYFINDKRFRGRKGGTLNLLPLHPNAIARAMGVAFHDRTTGGRPLWGHALKNRLYEHFHETWHLKCEVFGEWLPDVRARVTLDPRVRDKWGAPVARAATISHPVNRELAAFLTERGTEVLRALGARHARGVPGGGPSTNLIGGTCRFGNDPNTSVLDSECRSHEVKNLFVTDASFMPSGGAVPFTFTIYANALRVADAIIRQLGGPKKPAREKR